ATVRKEQEELRRAHAARHERPLLSYEAARANRLTSDWPALDLPVPAFLGRRFVEPALEEITPFIDWTFFFSAWELKGRFPAILDHPEYGAAARDLYEHAQTLLARIVRDKLIRAKGVYGFWPASACGDDIVLYSEESRQTEIVRFHMLRQQ